MSNAAITRSVTLSRAGEPLPRDAAERFSALLAPPAPADTERRQPRFGGRESGRAAAAGAMCAETVDGLIDQVAEFVRLHGPVRAGRWSVTVWLRAAVLRDTRLAMMSEPGRIDIRFSTGDRESLRRLRAGLDELRTRLRERLVATEVRIAIEAVPAGEGITV
jgi:hypothetical protein